MKLRKGTRILHPKKPEWGMGEILQISNNEEVRVFFVNEGEKKILLKYVELEKIPAEEAAHPMLDNLRDSPELNDTKYLSLPKAIDHFLTQFPEGFHGDKFMDTERKTKMEAHLLGTELLGKERLADLLEAGEYWQICEYARKVINKTTLIFPTEKAALKNALENEATQEAFAKSLNELLYSEEPIKERFMDFARHLERINAAKWTLATYFLFIMFPEQYIFVKPTMSQNSANVSRFDLHFKTKLNWQTYEAALKYAMYLRRALDKDHGPRDMMDIQSFMWSIAK
ncbi:MAG: Unknown protein [uncultured Thiotrichaceae bacterium]|uniref:DUF3553 domain-containing protein n=1 Tax=uncultured Thiotrichaceae bacterium TaxID=298394 RepID=A0A6S6UAV6_9GAMM|nr:MAG: Unknown protein [uncultured Thiotrichaceae bacterium]